MIRIPSKTKVKDTRVSYRLKDVGLSFQNLGPMTSK